ncbi:MAG: universal stress protein, partial [Thermodesulfobacteriota bacterium]
MDIKKILWPTDGSRESEESLKTALYFAGKYGSEIVCLHVSEIQIPLTDLYPSYETVVVDIIRKTEERFKDEFDRLAEENSGVKFSSKIVRGSVVDWIVESAGTEGADLIVMGKKGHGLIGSTLLGSNTLKVLRNSPVPVLSVKPQYVEKEYDIKKILVPFDISDSAESSLSYSMGLARKLGASIIVVYVFWIDANVYEISPKLVDELTVHSSTELNRRVHEIKNGFSQSNPDSANVEIETAVLTGVSPALTITEYAEDNGFDLITVSTHGRKGIER